MKKVVHHVDNNPMNNEVWNLQIVSSSQNTQYAYDDGRIGSNYKLNAFQRRKVVELYLAGEHLISDLTATFGVSKPTIYYLLEQAGCVKHNLKKLAPSKRNEIKKKYVPYKITKLALAKEYGVSEGTIENVLREIRTPNHPQEVQ